MVYFCPITWAWISPRGAEHSDCGWRSDMFEPVRAHTRAHTHTHTYTHTHLTSHGPQRIHLALRVLPCERPPVPHVVVMSHSLAGRRGSNLFWHNRHSAPRWDVLLCYMYFDNLNTSSCTSIRLYVFRGIMWLTEPLFSFEEFTVSRRGRCQTRINKELNRSCSPVCGRINLDNQIPNWRSVIDRQVKERVKSGTYIPSSLFCYCVPRGKTCSFGRLLWGQRM